MDIKHSEANVKGIEVDVRASRNANGEVHFDTLWRNEADPKDVWRREPIDLPQGPDHYRMEFRLDDKSGHNLKFYGEPENAMYVQVGACPSGPGNGGGQIDFEDVDANKKKLTIKDFNHDPPCSLYYMLRFDGDRSGVCPPYQYDPEIRNGGGGIVE